MRATLALWIATPQVAALATASTPEEIFHVVAIHEDRDADLGEDEAGGAGEIQDGADNRVQLLGTAVERVEGCGGIGRLADGEGARRAKRMAAREQAARGD